MKILIGADVIPRTDNINNFKSGEISKIIGDDLLTRWLKADLKMFNLETPLVDYETPILKHGTNFLSPTDTIAGIKELDASLISLANNHIKDQDIDGINTTIDLLNEHHISWVGIMKSIDDKHPYKIIEKGGKKIGVYSCAENEFSIATKDSVGAVPFDPFESFDIVEEMKNVCDYVIVLYHGGIEHYRYPSPLLQKTCRKIASKGADLVVCQHSHCVGSIENYMDSEIVYGQGNFIFDAYIEFHPGFKTGILVEVNIEDEVSVDYLPIVINNHIVDIAKGKEKETILNGLFKRSEQITNPEFLEKKYSEFTLKKKDVYLNELSGRSVFMRRVDKYIFKGKLLEKKYNKKKLIQIRNYIQCEAHREALLSGLKDLR